jgi:hypothetical protein
VGKWASVGATAVETTTYTAWTEAKPRSGGEWRRYDLLVPHSQCIGDIVFAEWHDSPLELATDTLRCRLPHVVDDIDEREELPELSVRVRVWADEDTSTDPLALVQATVEEMEQARLANACETIATAEAAVKDAREGLYRQIVRSRDAGLARGPLAWAVRSRVSREALDRILEAHARARAVQAALRGQRASAYVANYDERTVHVRLDTDDAEFLSERLLLGPDCLEVESPETLKQANALHEAALQDAHVVLATLSDRYELRSLQGKPACPADLAAGPLTYLPVVVHDRTSR